MKAKKKIAVVSANLGNFEEPVTHIKQSVPVEFFLFTDENFPPRFQAMTPRLQSKIPKMFAWQMVPGYDYYLWIDGSCKLNRKDTVKWMLDQCKGHDIVVFKHPARETVLEEATLLKWLLHTRNSYVTSRYTNELIEEQLKAVDPNQELFTATAFLYKNNTKTQKMFKEWWYHTSRFHIIDQLSFPFALRESELKTKVLPDNLDRLPYHSKIKIPYIKYVRQDVQSEY